MHTDLLWPAPASAATGHTIVSLVLLATVAGGTAARRLLQGPVADARVDRRLLRDDADAGRERDRLGVHSATALSPHQVVAGVVLIGAVAMVQRAQEATALA